MSKLSKAVDKMNRAEKNLKGPNRLSKDPKRSEVEQRLFLAAERVKKEGIQ